MKHDLLSQVEHFVALTGLSEHRAGIVLAKNGRLLERLRDPESRMWPETEATIRANLRVETARRIKTDGAAA